MAVSNSTAALPANYEDLSTMEPLTQVSNQNQHGIVQQPHVTHKGRGSIHTSNIPLISSDVILPSQSPGDVVKILERTGYTRNSAVLLCLFSDGSQHRIRQKHLKDIIGDRALDILLHQFTTQ